MDKCKLFPAVLLACLLLTISACGSSTSSESGGNNSNMVAGIASKGPLSGATVTVYVLDEDGTLGQVLGTATTRADGTYNLYIGSYSGNMLVTVSGGTYLDEGTGLVIANPDTFRAGVVNASGPTTVNVTPYTEIAILHAGSYAAANITAANNRVSNMLGGINIITTKPSDVTDAAAILDPLASIEYGLALAAISQSVASGQYWDVQAVVEAIATDLDDGILDQTSSGLAEAVAECLAPAQIAIQLDLIETDIFLDEALAIAEAAEVSEDAIEVVDEVYIVPPPEEVDAVYIEPPPDEPGDILPSG